jgi:hypothetical protein
MRRVYLAVGPVDKDRGPATFGSERASRERISGVLKEIRLKIRVKIKCKIIVPKPTKRIIPNPATADMKNWVG